MPPKKTKKYKRGRKTIKSEVATSKLQTLVKKAITANNNKMLETKKSI